jgi:phenylpropionate dioxygenase-like ring-hydroxylating dioxygenase large terminal subunit
VNRERNRHTQPFQAHPVFNNWEAVAEGWYIGLPSTALKKGQAKSTLVNGQQLVFFRGEDGRVRCLDAFCPHMGTDLGIGKVVGNTLRCFFHHWRFDDTGACVDVPCGEPAPKHARLHAWPCVERYGFIWAFAGEQASSDGPAHPPSLDPEQVTWWHGRTFFRQCHHHVNMINGLDPQHLATVHDIHLGIDVECTEDDVDKRIDFVLKGELPADTARQRLARKVLGGTYSYAMRYGHANVGALTVVKDVYLFGKWKLPEIFTIWAYRMVAPGKSEVQTIYLTQRRKGLLGWLWSQALLLTAVALYQVLRDEDGAVYDNMRFNPKNLLKVDGPVARYIGYVNRLAVSPWSIAPPASNASVRSLRVVDDQEDPDDAERVEA